MESKAFNNLIYSLYPEFKIYNQSIPKDFKRPSFLVVTPEQDTRIVQRTKFFYSEFKNYVIFAFTNDVESLNDVKEKVLYEFLAKKKLLIDEEQIRYITIEKITAKTSTSDKVIEFNIETSQQKSNIVEKPVQKIRQVINKITFK